MLSRRQGEEGAGRETKLWHVVHAADERSSIGTRKSRFQTLNQLAGSQKRRSPNYLLLLRRRTGCSFSPLPFTSFFPSSPLLTGSIRSALMRLYRTWWLRAFPDRHGFRHNDGCHGVYVCLWSGGGKLGPATFLLFFSAKERSGSPKWISFCFLSFPSSFFLLSVLLRSSLSSGSPVCRRRLMKCFWSEFLYKFRMVFFLGPIEV